MKTTCNMYRPLVILALITITSVNCNPLFGLQSPSNEKSSSSSGLLGLGNLPSKKSNGSTKSSKKKDSEKSRDDEDLMGSLMKSVGKSPKKAPRKSSEGKKKGQNSKSKSKPKKSLVGGLVNGKQPDGSQKAVTYGFLMKKPQRSPDGFQVDEGDIAITDEDFLRKAVRHIELWRDGVIFYIFDKSVNETMKDLFNLAMKEWEDYTCLKFREKQGIDQVFFAKYRTDNDGCYSFVGRQTKDILLGQDVNLGAGCDSLHTAVHELGHMLGLSHEQSRSDRDTYLRINFENIEKELYSQFEKQKTRNEEAEYDYKSVMQYPSWGFSISPFEKITMSTRNPMLQYLIDEERQGLSFKDIKVINKIYGCKSRCKQKKSCQNSGILVPFKSEDKTNCICMCPNGYEGDECEDSVDDSEELPYYGGLRCGGNITEETTITSPKRTLDVPGCSWWIQAPEGMKIRADFSTFDFRPIESYGIIEDKCIFEKVEIRASNIYDPMIFCGTELSGKSITSEGSNLVIVVVSDIRGTEKLVGSGLVAKITFEEGGVDITVPEKKGSDDELIPGLL